MAADTPGRGPLRLVVPSPDRARVLARPNGLAGWTLPAVPVELPFDAWSPADLERAAAIVGAPVEPLHRLDERTWVMTVTGRIPAAGTTWIGEDETGRLGSDAGIADAWFAHARSAEG